MQNSLKVSAIALVLGVIGMPPSTASSHTDDIVELQVQNGSFQPPNLIVKTNIPFKLKVTNADKSPIEFESFSLHR